MVDKSGPQSEVEDIKRLRDLVTCRNGILKGIRNSLLSMRECGLAKQKTKSQWPSLSIGDLAKVFFFF